MRGHIRRRGNKWAVVVDVGRDENGRRRQRWHSGYDTRRDAQKALTEILGRLEGGTYIEPTKETLGQYLTEWLEGQRGQVRESTWVSYRLNVECHVLPALGTVPLQSLTAAALNGFYASLLETGRKDGAGLSPRTTRYIHTILRKSLKDAVRWSRVTRNVADLADPPSPRATAPRVMRTWTATELKGFLAHASDERLYALYFLAGYTGMRRGEVLGLRWRDLDLDGGRASITQTLIAVAYRVSFSTPKTARGRRSVALDAETVRVLREHRRRQLEERLALGGYAEDFDLVFAGLEGEPLHPDQVSKRFDKLVRAAGLPRIRFHDLRHTHATLALQAGIHPKVISERLGHATVSITLDTYSHAVPALEEEAAEKVAAVVFGS